MCNPRVEYGPAHLKKNGSGAYAMTWGEPDYRIYLLIYFLFLINSI